MVMSQCIVGYNCTIVTLRATFTHDQTEVTFTIICCCNYFGEDFGIGGGIEGSFLSLSVGELCFGTNGLARPE